MLEEFKAFITRGRVVDLAVGIVIGVAFASLVTSLVANIVTPLVTIPGEVDFSDLSFTIGGGTFRYGAFLNDLISFVIVAGAVFFGVVRPLGRLSERSNADRATRTKECPECLSTIPGPAARCAFAPVSSEQRWTARPGASRALTLAVLAVPVVAGVAAGWAVTARLRGSTTALLTAAAAIVVTLLVVYVVRHLAERLLPLASLLQLDLPFPGRPPSRFGVALRAGSTRRLQTLVLEDPTTDAADAAVTILAFAAALSRHDRATRGHSERVRALADLIGEAVGLDVEDRDRLRWAALLHDVGKLGVHADVLNKDSALDEAEWEEIRTHPLEGARMAEPLRPFLGDWVTSVEHHHERWDGTGYPHGLAGKDIAYGARIVAVADTYEVMTSPVRNYRTPVSPLAAQRELATVAGTQLDPDVVRAFLTINERELRRALSIMALVIQLPNLLRLRAPLRAGATPVDVTGGLDGSGSHARHPDAQLDPRSSPASNLDGDADGADDVGLDMDR